MSYKNLTRMFFDYSICSEINIIANLLLLNLQSGILLFKSLCTSVKSAYVNLQS